MASRGVNKVILVGNLGADPETRYTQGGSAVTNLSVATSERWKDKQSGDDREQTEWHRVVMFARLAEIAAEYLRKGSKVYVEGRIQTRKWQGQDGQDRYTTEIVANEMQMLDSRGEGGGGGGGYGGGGGGGSSSGGGGGYGGGGGGSSSGGGGGSYGGGGGSGGGGGNGGGRGRRPEPPPGPPPADDPEDDIPF